MKNVKLTSRKAGFSLVEMLVVIAIIGIIAAIAIPNIGSINKSARYATAQRNAQSVASVMNAAIAAGGSLGLAADAAGAAVIDVAETGVTPTDGSFKDKLFTVGDIDDSEEPVAAVYLSYSAATNQVVYNPKATPYTIGE
jgi:type IV pilus assembly protein PilA